MKILLLCKRRPQQRDLVTRPYGRFHHIPASLAALGHEVRVVLIGHHGTAPERIQSGGVIQICLDLRRQRWSGAIAELSREASSFAPDWVMGCSDTWLGWLAHRVARQCGARLAIDAYDNYESYMPWNYPLHVLWRRSVRAADLVTAAGPQLAELLNRHRLGRSSAVVLPMAADAGFHPMNQENCRNALDLPASIPLLGYYGGWAASRGTELLVQAFREVRRQLPNARLVLTGSPPATVLQEPGVLPLGYLDDANLPVMVNSLDAACVITADNSFGRFSYPSKLCEAMACGVAVAATGSEPVRWMLHDDERRLAPMGDVTAFARCALSALEDRRVDYGSLPTWDYDGRLLDQWLRSPPTRRD